MGRLLNLGFDWTYLKQYRPMTDDISAVKSVTINQVNPGDVFYMKAIAETAGEDFASATFEVDTTACLDPVPGVPTVVSNTTRLYNMGTAGGVYRLTFSEGVTGVSTGLTWTPVVGTGTLGAATQLDPQTYDIAFSGAADGERQGGAKNGAFPYIRPLIPMLVDKMRVSRQKG